MRSLGRSGSAVPVRHGAHVIVRRVESRWECECHSEPNLCSVNDEIAPTESVPMFHCLLHEGARGRPARVAHLRDLLRGAPAGRAPCEHGFASCAAGSHPRAARTPPVTGHLMRELGRSRGFLLHLSPPKCDAQDGILGCCTLRVGSRRAWRAPAPPQVTPFVSSSRTPAGEHGRRMTAEKPRASRRCAGPGRSVDDKRVVWLGGRRRAASGSACDHTRRSAFGGRAADPTRVFAVFVFMNTGIDTGVCS